MNEDKSVGNSRKLGAFAAQAMQEMEDEYPDAELGEILIICELRNEDKTTTTRFTCTDGRQYVQIGILKMAQLAVERSG